MQSANQIIRNFHTSLPRIARHRRINPGISRQLKLYEGDDQLLKNENIDGFDDLESDFMEVHKTHKEHISDMEKERDYIRHKMVKHKYFRENKLPNLLTYAEKEQIRLLHSRDPEEWTAERLAESFPATHDIIQKILKNNWKPRSTKRIREHDEAVIQNWEKLRRGNNDFILSPELRDHIKKFATRKKEDLHVNTDEWSIPKIPKPKRQDFLSIITSCSKYAEEEQKSDPQPESIAFLKAGNPFKPKQPTNTNSGDTETYLLDNISDKRKMRIQELKKLKLTPADLATITTVSENTPNKAESLEQAALALNNTSGTGIISRHPHQLQEQNSNENFNFVKKFEETEIVISIEDQKRYEMSTVKDRVHIPRKLWLKGATYRVEDCYYDDDGEFLYRVPGMVGESN